MNEFKATKAEVLNRGAAPDEFLVELVGFGHTADRALFAPNTNFDIYDKVKPELGPWTGELHRVAVMLEVLRVLALFESECKWGTGADASRRSQTTAENAEAGPWQSSWDARRLDPSLRRFLATHGIDSGAKFQHAMKTQHGLCMEFTVMLLRIDVTNFERLANGPLRKGAERKATWPDRPTLWSERQSIYPWLSRDAVAEFEQHLA